MSAIAGLLVAGWPRWRPPWRGPACCCTSQPPSSPPPPGCRTTSSWVSNTQYPNDIGENKTVKLRSPVQYPSCAARYLDIWAVHTWWSAAGAFSGDYPRMSRPPPRCCRRSVTRTRCWAHAGSWSTRGLTQIFFFMFWRLPEASLNQSTENSMQLQSQCCRKIFLPDFPPDLRPSSGCEWRILSGCLGGGSSWTPWSRRGWLMTGLRCWEEIFTLSL